MTALTSPSQVPARRRRTLVPLLALAALVAWGCTDNTRAVEDVVPLDFDEGDVTLPDTTFPDTTTGSDGTIQPDGTADLTSPPDATGPTDVPFVDIIEPLCGDGIAEGPETCDGADLRGSSCQSLGFSGGTLSCAADCRLDDTACVRRCDPGTQLACADGSCVPLTAQCDGQADCPSGADEAPTNPNCTMGGEVCGNGADDDGDGAVDCDDTDCASAPFCVPAMEVCDNGIDDDANGVADCNDPVCVNAPNCQPTPEVCDNGVDDDGDGAVDCNDTDCAMAASCACNPMTEFTCAGGQCISRMALCDESVDCPDGDDEAPVNSSCVVTGEICGNGADDDGDGLTDCADGDCASDPTCAGGCDPTTQFECSDGACVAASAECNTFPNCSDGSDEFPLNANCMCQADGTIASGPMSCCNGDPDQNGLCGDQGGMCTVDGDFCDPAGPQGQCCSGGCVDGAVVGAPNFAICCIGDGFDYTTVQPPFDDPAICCNGDADGDGLCGGVAMGEVCNDGQDNDGDGDVDCDDSDCAAVPSCAAPEDCGNGVDDDFDGQIDCADSDCAFEPSCIPDEICGNGIDDDFDGQPDCFDPDCFQDPVCAAGGEDCSNGMDDDGDGAVDCADAECAQDPVCNGCGASQFACADGLCVPASASCNGFPECQDGSDELPFNPNCPCQSDNTVYFTDASVCCNGDADQNGLCGDQGGMCIADGQPCAPNQPCCNGGCLSNFGVCCIGDGFLYGPLGLPASVCCNGDSDGDGECGVGSENCTNGVDDDADGDIDCADVDCAAAPACAPTENCSNGIDDDGNGFVDCQDFACFQDPACQMVTENCSNGIDDDGNGFVDCQDFACFQDPACQMMGENCSNGVDDDGDNQVDCQDFDCFGDPACAAGTENNCTNGMDDDGDGQTDCDDSDCANRPQCASNNCPGQQFECGDGLCIDASAECNGFPECPDFSDELPANSSCACQLDGTTAIDPAACCNGDPDGNFTCGDQTANSCVGPGLPCDNDPCCSGGMGDCLGQPGQTFCCATAGVDYGSLGAPSFVCCDGDSNNDGLCD